MADLIEGAPILTWRQRIMHKPSGMPYNLKHINLTRELVEIVSPDRLVDVTIADQRQDSTLGLLALLTNRILIHVLPFAIDADSRRFHGELHRIAIDHLEQTRTLTKRNVCNTQLLCNHSINDLLDGMMSDAVTLDHANKVRKDFIAHLIDGVTKRIHQLLNDRDRSIDRITRVRTHNKASAVLSDQVAKFEAPFLSHRLEDVV